MINLNRKDYLFIANILSIFLEHGMKGILNILNTWDLKKEPSLKDIQGLRKHIEKKPEDYFTKDENRIA